MNTGCTYIVTCNTRPNGSISKVHYAARKTVLYSSNITGYSEQRSNISRHYCLSLNCISRLYAFYPKFVKVQERFKYEKYIIINKDPVTVNLYHPI